VTTLTRSVHARALAAALAVTAASAVVPARTPRSPQDQAAAQGQQAQPAIDQWADAFDGDKLDDAKWEIYTFDGSGGKVEVKGGQLRMHGAGVSRSGIRSRETFHADRFYVEASLAKVEGRPPEPGESSFPPGFAVLTVLFNGNPKDRIEWILRSDGIFEAWASVDGRMQQLDDHKLATKEKSPKLGIAKKGDDVFFMLNGQVGLQRTVRGLGPDFKVMLYGFGASPNDWDAVTVQTLKKQ
jgi:hypothetical protein